MHRPFWISVLSASLALFFFYPSPVRDREFPEYRVVIDPGHGGETRFPVYLHGDRFDTVTGGYLELYREGASGPGVREHLIMYAISEKVVSLLKDASPEGKYGKFHDLIAGYTDKPSSRVAIRTIMSRPASIGPGDRSADPNSEYRLYDFTDKNGMVRKGRISIINEYRPHLVVSLHCASSGPQDYKGMSAVIAPSYDFLYNGLLYLRGKKRKSSFFKGPLAENWFCESEDRSNFSWFLNDSSLYFLCHPIDEDHVQRFDRYKGYRHNMVQWKYGDRAGWEIPAGHNIKGSHYSRELAEFRPEGPFWERERARFEKYRRDGGPEGYGGDNAYAGNEIIRFIQHSLAKNGAGTGNRKPGKPYVSVWAVPVLVNAISAYIELGYLKRREDRNIMVQRQDEIAEGVAVGIYSLLAGIRLDQGDDPWMPRGKRIDLDRYRDKSEKSYFDSVSE